MNKVSTTKKYSSHFLQLKVGHDVIGWRRERRKLIRNLQAKGISTERKGLAELLANKMAMGPLLRFLKSTKWEGEKEQR